MSEAEAAMRAFDQSGHVGDHEAAILTESHHAEIRHERREWVIGNLRPRRGNARDHRRLAGVGKTDETHVSEQLQLETHVLDFAGLSRLAPPRE